MTKDKIAQIWVKRSTRKLFKKFALEEDKTMTNFIDEDVIDMIMEKRKKKGKRFDEFTF